MEFLQPRSLSEAIAAKAEHPAAVPIAGGTDVMVEIDFDARRPEALLDLNRISGLTSWQRSNGRVRVGAGSPGWTSPAPWPPVRLDVLELAAPHAPYGLRGVGEPPTISSTPAVVAAIRRPPTGT
jgi:FAD binding domain in molybdopterin dehydrogenase